VAKPTEGFDLDLADPLAGHIEASPDLLQRVLGFLSDSKAESENLLFL
jgi:hypothetical protein